MAARVAVLDPDPDTARRLAGVLAAEGHRVTSAADLDELASLGDVDLLLVEASLANAVELARLALGEDAPAVLRLAGLGYCADPDPAEFETLAHPLSDEQVRVAARRALDRRSLRAENERLRASLDQRGDLGNVKSRDPAMRALFRTLEAVADTRATVLLTGESGTGKSLLAEALHARSSRRDGPLVTVNCGALPPQLLESELFGHARGAFTGAVRDKPGRFEAADGGTLFLDEIATAPPDLQVKLLRVLQDREFERVGETRTRRADVRLVCATNRDLRAEVAAGRFREDLYYRIHVIALELPPLRDRPGDVPLLARHFLECLGREHGRPLEGFEPGALAKLVAHDWPGNVRELQHAVERALLLAPGPRVRAADLVVGPARADAPPAAEDPEAGPILPLKQALEGPERRLIQRALRRNAGNRKATAEQLGINRTTLFNKMRKYGLFEDDAARREEP
jgi:DNA-binding NtrC family response regulator